MEENKLRRFYRSNLPTIVWNKEKGCVLVEFVNGQYFTEDEELAKYLISLGYPEVSLEAEVPPDILFGKGVILEGNIKVMPKGVTEESVLNREKMLAHMASLKARKSDSEKVDNEPSPVPDRVKKKSSKTKSDDDRIKLKKSKKKKSDVSEKTSKKKKKTKKLDG